MRRVGEVVRGRAGQRGGGRGDDAVAVGQARDQRVESGAEVGAAVKRVFELRALKRGAGQPGGELLAVGLRHRAVRARDPRGQIAGQEGCLVEQCRRRHAGPQREVGAQQCVGAAARERHHQRRARFAAAVDDPGRHAGGGGAADEQREPAGDAPQLRVDDALLEPVAYRLHGRLEEPLERQPLRRGRGPLGPRQPAEQLEQLARPVAADAAQDVAAQHLERAPRHLAGEAAVLVQRGQGDRQNLAIDLGAQVGQVEMGAERAVPAQAHADAVDDERGVDLADAQLLPAAGAEAKLGVGGG